MNQNKEDALHKALWLAYRRGILDARRRLIEYVSTDKTIDRFTRKMFQSALNKYFDKEEKVLRNITNKVAAEVDIVPRGTSKK